MKKMILSKTLKPTNTAEAYFGNALLFGDKMLVPYYNLHLMDVPNIDPQLKHAVNCFIRKAYLYYEGIENITWDYDISRLTKSERQECYGGTNIFDGEHYEYWILYKKGTLILEEDFSFSNAPYSLIHIDETIHDFLNLQNKTEVLETIARRQE